MVDRISVDLTALRPASLGPDDEIRPVWPSFCLPWFQGEAPMVGELARVHRRSSDPYAWELESCLELDRRGRYHFAEGWLALTREADSIHPANVEIGWTPTGEGRDNVRISFPDVVRAVLEQRATRESAIALVVPDSLGPGPAQEIIDQISSGFRRIQLVPRTVAGAVAWCNSKIGRLQLGEGAGEAGSREGSLLVTTTAADTWEVAVVPIRFEGSGAEPSFCPIHERVQHRSEIGACGLERSLAMGASPADAEPASIWSSWLQESGEVLSLAGDGPNRQAMNQAFTHWCLEGRTGRQLQSHEMEVEVCQAVEQAQNGLGILGWLHVDSFGTGEVPMEFDFLEDFDLPAPIVETPDVLLRGAAVVNRLMDEGATPYYESLAQVDLYVQGRNEYLDPVEDWQPLIEATEVPVGKTYESPKPIRGLSLPPGEMPVIDLVIRVHRRDEQVLGEFRAEQNKPQEGAVPVRIEARLRPGQGLSSFVVESESPGLFHAEVKESRVGERDKAPEILYSWPPGSAWVSSDPLHAAEAKPSLEMLLDALRVGSDPEHLKYCIGDARAFIGKWHHRNGRNMPDDLPPGIDPRFVYFGVFPSDRRSAHPSVEPLLRELGQLIPEALGRYQRQRSTLFSFSSWLYARCPKEILDQIRQALANAGTTLEESFYSCVGNCFSEPTDFRLFYKYLVGANQNRPLRSYTWIRAWRNLARFQADAMSLEALGGSDMEQLLKHYLHEFRHSSASRAGKSVFLHCCYLAPHLLKRRRFDPGFLKPSAASTEEFESVMHWALDVAPRSWTKLRNNLECTLEFLHNRADSETIQRLDY